MRLGSRTTAQAHQRGEMVIMPVADKLASGGRIGAFALVCAAPILFTTAVLNAQEIIDLPAEDRWLEPRFEEVYRIGSLSGEDWEQFGRVRKVAFDGAGQLYVLDGQVLHIHVVDRSGRLRRTLGGRGDGPGEFRWAPSFTVMPDGRVVVGDTGYRAFQIFDANGDYERVWGWDWRTWVVRYGISCPIRLATHCFPQWDPGCWSSGLSRTLPRTPPGQSSALTLLGTWSPGTPSPTAGCLRAWNG